MNRRFFKTACMTGIIMAVSMMLAGCNADLDQVAQSLEIVAENIDKIQTQASEQSAMNTDAPEDDVVPASDEAAKNGEIYILYTSDVHCGVDKGIGYAGLKQIRDTLIEQGYETILVDNGDFAQGETIGTISKGEAIVPIMNALEYDVAIPGDHEFDYGMDQFYKFTQMAEFPFVCCNFVKEDKPVFEPYIIKEAAGKKIAFIGITAPETMTEVSPATFRDEAGNYIYGFMHQDDGSTLYAAVQSAVDAARSEGADLVYVLGHIGNNPASKPFDCTSIIENTSGIDVFLDGHSHDTDQMVIKNKDGKDVTRSACGTKFNCVGFSHITKDGSIETNIWKWDGKDGIPYLFDIKNDITDMIDEAENSMKDELTKIVAKTDVDLTINDPILRNDEGTPVRIIRNKETNLGDLCADAVRIRTGADIGFVNGGGIRVSIDRGDITYNDIIDVHPFGNVNVVLEVKGQSILDALEWSCASLPDEEGGFLQVSGLTFEVDASIPSPCTTDENGLMNGINGDRRVSNVKVGDEPLEPEKSYTVAGNSYLLLKNGNGYTSFDDAKVVTNDAGLDNQLLIDYIVETLGGTVGDDYSDPYGQGRIVINE